MRADYRLFCWIVLAASTYAGQEKDANLGWKSAEADDGLRQAFERTVYRLENSGPGHYEAVNPAQRLVLEFNHDGARLIHPQGDAALRLTGFGYDGRLRTPLEAKPAASGNRVEYQRGDLSEWYVNGSRGLEQGFTLARRPGGSHETGPLKIALEATGELRPELTAQGDAVLLRSKEGAVLRYAGLRAWDARGCALASKLEVSDREVRLVVEDRSAEYPIVVDPLWTQQAELTASDGKIGDNFGWSVSVSGNTALIGAYSKKVGSNASQGAAYIFSLSGSTWSQIQELTASDGKSGDDFGWSVGLSGNTAVIGAPDRTVSGNVTQGTAYVFVLSGSTWTLQQELTSSDATNFGYSASLDGNTLLIGADSSTVSLNPNQGTAYVYERSGSRWSLQQELTAAGGSTNDQFGFSVAVKGNTTVAGAINKK